MISRFKGSGAPLLSGMKVGCGGPALEAAEGDVVGGEAPAGGGAAGVGVAGWGR